MGTYRTNILVATHISYPFRTNVLLVYYCVSSRLFFPVLNFLQKHFKVMKVFLFYNIKRQPCEERLYRRKPHKYTENQCWESWNQACIEKCE